MNDYRTEELYFQIKFQDERLTIPIIHTLRFVNTGVSDDGEELVFFDRLNDDGTLIRMAIRQSDAREFALDSKELISTLQKCFDGSLAKVGR